MKYIKFRERNIKTAIKLSFFILFFFSLLFHILLQIPFDT
jgi:hypothetical protein